jgi:flagellar basal body rod protein FlgG
MDLSLYLAYAGLRAETRAVEVTANNLANAGTSGFREDRDFVAALDAAGQQYAQLGGTQVSPLPGPQVLTGRDLDVAIEGDGYLVVQTPAGRRYTRNGALGRDAEGRLTSRDGFPVLDGSSPIVLPAGAVTIATDGGVSVEGTAVGRLALVRLAGEGLIREGQGLYRAEGVAEAPADGARLHQGHLERSNVDPVRSTVELVQSGRRFEALTRAIHLVMNNDNRRIIESTRP